jgi:hypothetical protein
MSGSHAAEIIELFQSSEDWSTSEEDEAEPELDLPPLPPPRPSAGWAIATLRPLGALAQLGERRFA